MKHRGARWRQDRKRPRLSVRGLAGQKIAPTPRQTPDERGAHLPQEGPDRSRPLADTIAGEHTAVQRDPFLRQGCPSWLTPLALSRFAFLTLPLPGDRRNVPTDRQLCIVKQRPS